MLRKSTRSLINATLTILTGLGINLLSEKLGKQNEHSWQFYLIFFAILLLLFLLLEKISGGLFDHPSNETQLSEQERQKQDLRNKLLEQYQARLKDKMDNRRPINLRTLPSTQGTSEEMAATFIKKEDIGQEIGKRFEEAAGRLLMVGEPGAGKTTLLLQLAVHILAPEASTLAIVVNLATWKSSYETLENWLAAVLAAELSTGQGGAKLVLQQPKLILLLDGLDELKEEEAINSCLAALAEHGKIAERQFVITCRKEKYEQVSEDARVNMQIEVAPLTGEQLIAELKQMAHQQPEAMPLLQAFEKDPLLLKIAETPFYFNTLQSLYAGRLPKPFTTTDEEERKQEITRRFVDAALQGTKKYPPEQAAHWLSFLADRMNKRGIVVFELRDLQYDWWGNWKRGKRFEANFIYGLIRILPMALLFSLIIGLSVGLLVGLIAGIDNELGIGIGVWLSVWLFIELLTGLFAGFIKKHFPIIDTHDFINWSLKAYLKQVKANFDVSFIIAMGLISALGSGQISGLFSGCTLCAVNWVVCYDSRRNQIFHPNNNTLPTFLCLYKITVLFHCVAFSLTLRILQKRRTTFLLGHFSQRNDSPPPLGKHQCHLAFPTPNHSRLFCREVARTGKHYPSNFKTRTTSSNPSSPKSKCVTNRIHRSG